MLKTPEPKVSLPSPSPSRSQLSNVLVSVLSIGLLIWSFHLIRGRFTTVTGLDAVVNGSLTEIKASFEGIASELKVKTGDVAVREQTLLVLKNNRVSQLPIQEIKSRIDQNKVQLLQAQSQLAYQLDLLQKLKADEHNQKSLETLGIQKSIEQARLELNGVQSTYQLARLTYNRMAFLKAQGVVSQAELDAAKVAMEQRQSEIASKEANVKVLDADLQAAKLGLSLSRTRSNFDPRIRLEELQLQIDNQRQVIRVLEQNIKSAEAELVQANADLTKKQTVVVKAPVSGVVWRLSAQEGKFVQQGESIGQMLECSKRWVDVFVDERALRSIQLGTPATIHLYGSTSPDLHGQVSMIRSGLGRLTAGEDIAVPIPPNSPRNTQVRVELDPNTDQGQSGFFCYVGYTGKVTFQVNP